MTGAVLDIVLVAAVAENGVIGRAGGLPWRLKSDLQQFRALTTGKPIVMGRRTWASLAKALPQRTNIVVTRDPAFAAAGAVVTTSLAGALAVARGDALRRNVNAIMVIGGGDIYAQAMPLATRLEITHVHARPDGEAVFPPIDPAIWRETARRDVPPGPGDDAGFTRATYVRAQDSVNTPAND
jgi:dihydrofolate reductase